MIAGLVHDLRYALRQFRTSPGFAAMAVLTLALGIGATTAVFSVVRGVLLEPLPYDSPDGLAMVWEETGDVSGDTWLSLRELVEYRTSTSSFDRLAAYTMGTATLAEEEPERVRAARVTSDLFATLGVRALHGRTFADEHGEAGRDDVVILSHGLWQRQFGGAADVIGRRIQVAANLVGGAGGAAEGMRTVIGVMPPGFRLPLDYREEAPTDIWVPQVIGPTASLPWGSRSYYLVGRLGADVTAEQATADLQRAVSTWVADGRIDPRSVETPRAAFALDELLLGNVRPALWTLFGAVGLLLVLACANVAHLLLARADARRQTVATQVALGASHLRVARQLLMESGLLAVGGAALGVLLAYGAVRVAMVAVPVNAIRMREVTLDLDVLAFALALTAATTLITGLVPALRVRRTNVAGAMAGARGDVSSVRRGARRWLVAGETALSLMLVVGALLLTRSLAELRAVDLGFETEGVLTLALALPSADYPEQASVNAFYRELVDGVAELPGVETAGAARILPLAANIGDWSLTIEDRPPEPGENMPADWQVVTPGYLEAMRIELVEGRVIGAQDDEEAPLVAVINQTMAARYWPGRSAIGGRFHLGTLDQPWIEVVGVARDVRRNGVLDEARAEMYVPHAQWGRARDDGQPQRTMTLVVRTAGDPLALVSPIRERVRELDPNLPVADVRTLDDVYAAALAEPRFLTLLLGVFAAFALLLAATGVYGVISFLTARRTREIGLRMALGARSGEVVRLILRDGLVMAGMGIAAGLLGALWLARLISGELYGVAALDPMTFLAAPLLLLAVAAAAAYVPGRRAALVDPVTVLREE